MFKYAGGIFVCYTCILIKIMHIYVKSTIFLFVIVGIVISTLKIIDFIVPMKQVIYNLVMDIKY